MQGPSTKAFKQAFLNSLQLQQAHTSKHEASSLGGAMNLRERKLAIKSSADVAMAAARGGGPRWPKAILASSSGVCKVQRCRRIVVRCRGWKRGLTRSARTGGGEAARRLARRTMALREVIPGGRDAAIDEAALLREAMDYVAHLRAQVDVLRRVSEAVEISS